MKILKVFILIIFLSYIGLKNSFAEDCSKFDKFKLKEKLLKFKNSKSHKDFIKK